MAYLGRCISSQFLLSLSCIFPIMMFYSYLYPFTKPQGPVHLGVQYQSSPGGRALIVQCSLDVAFNQGHLWLDLAREEGTTRESVQIWSGESGAGRFEKTIQLPFNISRGKKADVIVHFQAVKNSGDTIIARRDLYMQSLPDTVLTSDSDYDDLLRKQLKREMRQKGLDGKSLEFIRKRDPDLARRIEKTVFGRPDH